MTPIAPRLLAAALFDSAGEDIYVCRICSAPRKQASAAGYSNLLDHLTRCHASTYMDEYKLALARRGNRTLEAFTKIDASAANLYHWMDWIIMEGRELSMCEKTKTRNYSNLQPVCSKTLKKTMFEVECVVQSRVAAQLEGKRVGLAIDAWTEGRTHFVAVVAVTPGDKFLLCFSTLENEGDLGADSTIVLLDDVLDNYKIDLSQVCFFVCDHASVNAAVARKTGVPMIGCSSHRLNLAINHLLEPHTDLISKVHHLMTKLNTIKYRHALREADALMPVLPNVTWWGSTFAMLDRFLLIVRKLDGMDERLADAIPNAREVVKLKALHEDLENLESVSKQLQKGSGVSMADVRLLFGHVVEHYPVTKRYLSPAAAIVKFPHFEAGVAKLYGGDASTLTKEERHAVAKLLLAPEAPPTASVDRPGESFAQAALNKGRAAAAVTAADLTWIPPTSNEVERLFSRAGMVYSSVRRAMSPSTLETLMFLQFNRELWDASAVAEAREGQRHKRRRVEES